MPETCDGEEKKKAKTQQRKSEKQITAQSNAKGYRERGRQNKTKRITRDRRKKREEYRRRCVVSERCPCIVSTSYRMMARPSPLPPCWRAIETPACEKGAKSSGSQSGLMPGLKKGKEREDKKREEKKSNKRAKENKQQDRGVAKREGKE